MRNMRATLFLLSCLFSAVYCSRILVVPWQGKSHMISTNAIGQELKKNGHVVYTIAEDYYKGKPNRIGAVGLEILYYYVPEGTIYIDSDKVQKRLIEYILRGETDYELVPTILAESCKNMFADESFMDKVSSLKFDLAVVEGIPIMPCAYLLPHILKVPHVTFVPGFFPATIPGFVGLPSYLPPFFMTPKSMPMSFTERLLSTVGHIATTKQVLPIIASITGFLSDINDLTLMDQFREKGLVSDSIRGWMDFFDETQLMVLANADLTFDHPKPLFPNVISVEGLSVKKAKPLSEEMENLVQSSEDGVIVVSFGSNVQYLPDDIIIKMVNVFRKRKELFLMRYSGSLNEHNFDMPKNVKFLSWLPQNDLLAHNNTKLFITHGGANGLHEAVYQGVPMLCVPLFGDQPENAKKLEAKGFGLQFHLTEYTEEELLGKIEKIISNPSFRQKTVKAGQIMRHRPMNARQTAAFWIEHVLLFGGEHLRPSSMDLTWWQFYCLDTLGFIAFVVTLAFVIFIISLKFLVKVCFNFVKPSSHAKKD